MQKANDANCESSAGASYKNVIKGYEYHHHHSHCNLGYGAEQRARAHARTQGTVVARGLLGSVGVDG